MKSGREPVGRVQRAAGGRLAGLVKGEGNGLCKGPGVDEPGFFQRTGSKGVGPDSQLWCLEPAWGKLLGTWSRGRADGSGTLDPAAPGWPPPP